MIKAILFDADGVLINGEQFSSQLERDYGITKEQTKDFFTKTLPQATIGKADLKEILAPYLKKWGWGKSLDDFLEYWFTSEHHIDEELVRYIQSLRQRNIICCLATNQEKYRIDYMVTRMGFAETFDKVYASCHMGIQKPDLVFFETVIKDLKIINPKEILFFDDKKTNIEAAKTLGINAEIYTNYDNFKRQLSLYITE